MTYNTNHFRPNWFDHSNSKCILGKYCHKKICNEKKRRKDNKFNQL